MERPTWVTVTALLGVLFSLLSLAGTLGWAWTPPAAPPDRAVISSEAEPPATGGRVPGLRAGDFFVPKNYVRPLSPVSRWATILLDFLYLAASLGLLRMRGTDLWRFQWVLGLSTGFHLLRASAALASLSILGIALVGGSLFWLVVNAALFAVLRLNDRSAFQ